MINKTCCHHAYKNRCVHDACEFFDSRSPLEKCFGREPNGTFAQALHAQDEAEYDRLRDEAVRLKMVGPNLRQKRAQAMLNNS